MIALIIAGGKGERLKNLIGDVPKPMVQIDGKPVLEHQINLLRHYGITDIYILTGYRDHIIKDYFEDGKAFGADIKYYSEDKPLGTSGCVKVLEDKIRDHFLVFYGDIMFDMKLDDFVIFHKDKNGAATLVVHPNDHPYDSDIVVMDDNCRITDFLLKDRNPQYYENLVNAAVYALSPTVFKYIPEKVSSDFVRDIFPEMLRYNETIYGYKTTEYFKDIGTVDRLERVRQDFASGKIQRFSKRYRKAAIFMDRDGTLVEDVDLLYKVDDLKLYPFSGSAIKRINRSDYLAFLVTNQSVVARNLCDILMVKKIHNKLETLLGEEGAYLNDIYFCPHHPDKGYPEEDKNYKVDCNCRKPKTGMIERAVREYNLNIELSWFIGDTTVDIQTGINAGLKTILVRTGKGGKDRTYPCISDFGFDNLETAIDFILEEKQRYFLYINQIVEHIEGKKSLPFIISVGGLARSGKTTFVRLLVQALQKHDISTQVLSLDHWLFGANERTEYMNVRERYKYNGAERDLARLINREKILLKTYDSYSRNITGEEQFSLDDSGCLVIEGVPGLDIDGLRGIVDLKVYIEIDEDIRKKRFFSFYQWKNLSAEEIETLYQKRLKDEVPFIEESRKYADVVVKVS